MIGSKEIKSGINRKPSPIKESRAIVGVSSDAIFIDPIVSLFVNIWVVITLEK